MRKCPKCGNNIENDYAKFCKKCGTNLPGIKPSLNITNPTEETRVPEDSTLRQVINQETNTPHILNKQTSRNDNSPVEKPKTYLSWAILSTLFCCIPAGIYAIICSNRVSKYFDSGNYIKSNEESKKAKKWSLISFWIGVSYFIICFIIGFVGSISEYSENNIIDETTEEVVVQTEEEIEIDDIESLSQKTTRFLENAIEVDRRTLPMDMGNGMTMTDVKIINDYVFYYILCDEDIINLRTIDKTVAKTNILATLQYNSDDNVNHFVKLCKQANKGIAYEYKGDDSGKTLTVHIPCDEL